MPPSSDGSHVSRLMSTGGQAGQSPPKNDDGLRLQQDASQFSVSCHRVETSRQATENAGSVPGPKTSEARWDCCRSRRGAAVGSALI